MNLRDDFVLLSEKVQLGTPEHKRLKMKAEKIGALVKFGNVEYINLTRYLNHYSETKQIRIDARQSTKAAMKKSAGRYGNIKSVLKLDVVQRQIEKAIEPRNKRIEELTKALENETGESARKRLSADLNRQLLADDDSGHKLEQLRIRRDELETENKARIAKRKKGQSKNDQPTEENK